MIQIRRARLGDLQAVQSLLTDAALPLTGVADHFDSFLVAEYDHEIVAAAGLEVYGQWGLLRSVVVSPRVAGRGIGGELTARVLRRARELALRGVYLLTTTAADYFRRLGFDDVARAEAPPELRCSPEFAALCPDSAVCLAKNLT